MDSQYLDNKSLYDYIYIACKCIILIIITSALNVLSFELLLPLVVIMLSNFVENGYEFNQGIFKAITVKNILLLLLYSFMFHLVVYVYIYAGQVYSGVVLNVIRGLNIFVMIEMVLGLMYAAKYTFRFNHSLLMGIKNSIVLSNYKIAISMLALLVLLFVSIFLIILFEGGFLLLSSTIVMIWQVMSTKLFDKYKEESEKDNE